jgi:hypothetical protein
MNTILLAAGQALTWPEVVQNIALGVIGVIALFIALKSL